VFVFGGDITKFEVFVVVIIRSHSFKLYVFVLAECLTVTYVVIGTNK